MNQTRYTQQKGIKMIDVKNYFMCPSCSDQHNRTFTEALELAIEYADKLEDFVYIDEGEYTLEKQITISSTKNKGCKGILGAGMGKTKIKFNWPQTIDWDPRTNSTDARSQAGILLEHVSKRTVANLSLTYEGEFYRKGESYFGTINGIYMEHTDDCLVSQVEVTGCNRAGVFLNTVDKHVMEGAKKHHSQGMDPKLIGLPKGNKIIGCNLHHNRVAGILSAWQEDLVVRDNYLNHNGHAADGGTGYGVAMGSGSVNINFLVENNHAEGNFRKGLDVHDAYSGKFVNNRVIKNRFHGIAIESRGYPSNGIDVIDNYITFDKTFRLVADDEIPVRTSMDYYQQRAIRIETKPQDWQSWKGQPTRPVYNVTGNVIRGVEWETDKQQGIHRVIEIRNNDQDPNVIPTWNIKDNDIEAVDVSDIMFCIAPSQVVNGLGNVVVENNRFVSKRVRSAPVTFQEENTSKLRENSIVFRNNTISVTELNVYIKALIIISTDKKLTIENNTIDLVDNFNKPLFDITSKEDYKDQTNWTVSSNVFSSTVNADVFKRILLVKENNCKVTQTGNTYLQKITAELPDKTY